MDMRTDSELIEAWRAGDTHAGAELFARYYTGVARFFRNKVARASQDDLIQATFLGCLEGKERFRGDSEFRCYLFSIANRRLRDHYRKLHRQRNREDAELDFTELTVAAVEPQPDMAMVARQEHRLLLEGLRRIPIYYQVVLELHYWEHLTVADIGQVLGIPLGTAKTRLRDGKIMLERELARIGASSELLRSTLDSLQRWAERVRQEVAG